MSTTHQYRIAKDAPGELLITDAGVQAGPGETFESPVAIRNFYVERKDGSKWVSTYVESPELSAEQQAEIDAAATWVHPTPESASEADAPEAPEPTGGES